MENANSIEIDFEKIENNNDFYEQLKSKIELPEYFGNNLDALYDALTGYVKLPFRLNLINLKLNQLENFSDLFSTLDDAAVATDYDFLYVCSMYQQC